MQLGGTPKRGRRSTSSGGTPSSPPQQALKRTRPGAALLQPGGVLSSIAGAAWSGVRAAAGAAGALFASSRPEEPVIPLPTRAPPEMASTILLAEMRTGLLSLNADDRHVGLTMLAPRTVVHVTEVDYELAQGATIEAATAREVCAFCASREGAVEAQAEAAEDEDEDALAEATPSVSEAVSEAVSDSLGAESEASPAAVQDAAAAAVEAGEGAAGAAAVEAAPAAAAPAPVVRALVLPPAANVGSRMGAVLVALAEQLDFGLKLERDPARVVGWAQALAERLGATVSLGEVSTMSHGFATYNVSRTVTLVLAEGHVLAQPLPGHLARVDLPEGDDGITGSASLEVAGDGRITLTASSHMLLGTVPLERRARQLLMPTHLLLGAYLRLLYIASKPPTVWKLPGPYRGAPEELRSDASVLGSLLAKAARV